MNYKIKFYTIKTNKRIINYIPKKNFILDILEKNKINIEFQCRKGYCGSCRIILISGKIYYPNNVVILASKLSRKEIFPCCCIGINNIILKI
ncbi:class I ribonucleotide reductase maintenance protein YfaE [Buchnera aphidicola (Neophyllaphis podocarpi)]|uniref:class I ribonucleotide reductase maintenance protein YfaE n=1 Tax=Buchnera aphidicola TaxID=9 RepID=UPI0031B87798